MGKRVSLQRLITLSVLSIGLLSGTFGLAYAYWQAKQSLRATIGLTFQELARQSADKVGLILNKEIEWVERLSVLPEVLEAVREGTRLTFDQPGLQRWRETQRQYFPSMVILDRQGRSVGGVTSDTTRTHYNMQPWWPVVFDQQRSWAGGLRLDESGRGYWEVAVPIADEAGTVLGALKVVIEKDQLLASVFRSRIGETGHVMLVGAQGLVLACPMLPPALHMRTGLPLESRDQSGRPLVSGAMWTEVENDTHGSRAVIVGVSPVRLPANIAQEGTWYILVRQDPSETYAPLRVLIWKLGAFGVLAVAVIALLRWRLARRIVQPINTLVERVRQFGQANGGTSLVAGPSAGIVEIDALSASFDEMAARLERASRERARYVRELEQANRDIAVSEEHFRMLWNHSVDSKLIVDSNGIVRDMNRRGEMKLGLRADELIGRPAAELVAEPGRLHFQEVIQEVLRTGKEQAAGEMLVPTPAGASLIVDVDLVPVEKEGAVTAVMLQLSDITEKKQLAEQLLRSERLASLSQFASMFAHDIRNPLAGIKKTLELLNQRPELQGEPVGRWCKDLRFTTDLLLGMINDMLDVYQESYSGLPLMTSRFSVKLALHEVVHLFRSEAEGRGISLRPELPDEDVLVTADRRRLQRVVMNLVHNALKYSPLHGEITIRLSREIGRSPASEKSETERPAVLICVEDEGPGVEPDELPHLFEMFFRKKDARDLRIGRGLGLHFCRLVVEAHHGRIWAANRPSGGARFILALPLEQEPACQSSS